MDLVFLVLIFNLSSLRSLELEESRSANVVI